MYFRIKTTYLAAITICLQIKGKQKVRDLWRQKDLGIFNDKFEITVPRHGAAVIELFPQK
ncbi:MAG: hypothetical protein ABFD79_16150 [Phycisphaerales bacterium]